MGRGAQLSFKDMNASTLQRPLSAAVLVGGTCRCELQLRLALAGVSVFDLNGCAPGVGRSELLGVQRFELGRRFTTRPPSGASRPEGQASGTRARAHAGAA